MVQILIRTPLRASGIAAGTDHGSILWNAWRSGNQWVITVQADNSMNVESIIDDIRLALLRPAGEWTQRWKQSFIRGGRRSA